MGRGYTAEPVSAAALGAGTSLALALPATTVFKDSGSSTSKQTEEQRNAEGEFTHFVYGNV